MPVLFIGHGNPMNAITENRYSKTLGALGRDLPRPGAIVCISAHWMTEGSWVTHMPRPRTIHDFFGFPEELFQVQYPAPGDPQIAELIRDSVPDPKIQLDDDLWGLDHGTWSVLRHIYPQANIPVLQLSLNIAQPFDYHYHLGQRLAGLRDAGILILGSGNIVHNLRQLNWKTDAPAFDWAVEFDEWAKEKLVARDDRALVEDPLRSSAGELSIPTAEHYLPLLYVLGAAEPGEAARFEYEGIENASISMRSLSFGR